MATRSIKLKLIVPRDAEPDSVALRRALWTTHSMTNEAVAHYEQLLLEMRQQDTCVGFLTDGTPHVIQGKTWHQRLGNRLAKNGVPEKHNERACSELRKLYERIVRSSVKAGSGSAQDGRTYHSRLVDPDSKGGDSAREKRQMWTDLIATADDPIARWERTARRIMSSNYEALQRATGAPARYVRLYGDDPNGQGWLEALQVQLQRWKNEPDDPLSWLIDHDVMPLARPYFADRMDASEQQGRGALTTHERTAFALAIGHLNAWESWGHRATEQYTARQTSVTAWKERYSENHADALKRIRSFEAKRSEELSKVAFWSETSCYRLRARELRGWPQLREWLLENPESTTEGRIKQVHELQRTLRRRFGSETVLRWLAHRNQKDLVEHQAGDVVSNIAAYNSRCELLARTKQLPLLTLAEPRLHPRYAQFDPPSNNNQPPYVLSMDDDGHMSLQIELLAPVDNEGHVVQRRRFLVPLAPSEQVKKGSLQPGKAPKKRLLRRRSQDGLDWIESEVGGACLMFERRTLDARTQDELQSGDIGSVWFRLALDNEGATQDEWRRRTNARRWFSSAAQNRIKCSPPEAGFRLLSVHLGVRCTAACSVFVVDSIDKKDNMPTVRHERSFLLQLPGDKADCDELERRRKANNDIWEIRCAINGLRNLRRLCFADEQADRIELLDSMSRSKQSDILAPILSSEDIEELTKHTGLKETRWRSLITNEYERIERDLGAHIDAWRKDQRERAVTARLGGKSFWTLEHLEATRRVLLQWARHHHPNREEVRRGDKERDGVFEARLLHHIEHLKGDRIKTTADLIVQAARGLVQGNARWHRRHDPVDLIVLEDMSHYRFRSERPREENSRLMRWAHREVVNTVRLQAEEVGILVAETSAPFSSGFDAWTNAPGIRCHAVTSNEVHTLKGEEQHWLRRVVDDIPNLDVKKLKPGDLLPTDGGNQLVALSGSGDVRVRHADINAAQAIGMRYLQAHRPLFRLAATKLAKADQQPIYINASPGDRAAGALGGKVAVLRPADADTEEIHVLGTYGDATKAAKAIGLARSQIGKTAADESAAASEDILEAEDAEEAAALLESASNDRKVFFRDPSGAIHSDCWVDARAFWRDVRQETVGRLRNSGRLHG